MKIEILHQGKRKLFDMDDGLDVCSVLRLAQINPETVIVNKNGEIIPDTEKLEDNDKIEAIRIVSGG